MGKARLLDCLIFVSLALFCFSPTGTPSRAAGLWYVATWGDDTNNDCLTPSAPCASINGVLAKPGFGDGETIKVGVGTYYGTGDEVVVVNRSATLSGGWDASFTWQAGLSTIDGQQARRGVYIGRNAVVGIDRFDIRNGLSNPVSEGELVVDGGAGIYNDGPARLSIENSTLTNNVATDTGGGLWNYFGTVVLSGSTVDFNKTQRGGSGAGMASVAGTMTVTNSTIDNNVASGPLAGTGAGAGIASWGTGSSLVIVNSTISNNVSFDHGGGILFSNGALVIRNSTISGNRSRYAGGIAIDSASYAEISSSTITNNVATGLEGGGGIRNVWAPLVIRNSILAGNGHSYSPDCHGSTGSSSIVFTSGGYNLIRYTDECPFTPGAGDLLGIYPLLGPLTDAPGYHPLRPGSPAIAAGNPSGCLDEHGDLLSTDQRGFQRVGRCDIGAYEYGATASPIGLYRDFLPSLLKNSNGQTCSAGICGRVFEKGAAAPGIPLDLRFYNGSAWSTIATTSTNGNGDYAFMGVASLAPGQRYFVRFLNSSNEQRLSYWATRILTSYISNSKVWIGDFDIANITLLPPGGTVPLPKTFQWFRRSASPGDSYEFNLFHPSDFNPSWWTDPTLGYVDSYVLWTLLPGFNSFTQYGWFMSVYSPDGGYGESFYYYRVTFLNAYSNAAAPERAGYPLKKSDLPTPKRVR